MPFVWKEKATRKLDGWPENRSMERIGKDMLHFPYRGAPPGSPFGRAVTEGDGEGAAPCFPLSGLASLGRRSHRERQGGQFMIPFGSPGFAVPGHPAV